MVGEFYTSARARLLVLKERSGKTTLVSTLAVSAVLLLMGVSGFFDARVPVAVADDVTTSVTVLNTPPEWTVDAQESTESSTTTPTNVGATQSWTGTATDSSGDNYYLLICKTSATPTANSGAAPTCGGGNGNRWAVSGASASASQATAATTTVENFVFANELNDWYAWICDGNASLPKCNTAYRQGTYPTESPFVINHPPVFASIANDGPEDPGGTVTWTATAYDTDVESTPDTVRLYVCKAADFTGTYCGAGGSWATSTLAASNPATTTTLSLPMQDATYAAYVYVVDNHGRVATSTIQASNSSFVVNNIAPTIDAALISIEDNDNVGNITLTVPQSTSGPFYVKFTVSDNNSCLNSASGNEFSSAITNVYRSGVGSTSCAVSGDYNANNCYPAASPLFLGLSCTQDGGTCSGSTDSSANWTCSFPLWYVADPTDATTPWTSENWLATVQVTDDDSAQTPLTEATTGNDVSSFLAFNVSSTSIGFGALEPGQYNNPLSTSTDMIAQGNIGLDEDLYGDTMCTTWSAPDSCDTNGINPANDIIIENQRAASTTAVGYYSTSSLVILTGSTSPTELNIRVPKTTSTSSPQTRYTYWGIRIPSTITLAGSYSGQNTITAKKSNIAFW